MLVILNSCSGLEDAGKVLRNEKTRTTDEFLIEKRGPLSIPPKMGELPVPSSNKKKEKDNRSILGAASEGQKQNERSELENILLEEIRKN